MTQETNYDFSVDAPFIDADGIELWVEDFGDEGVFLCVKPFEKETVRVDLDRISVRMLAERLSE